MLDTIARGLVACLTFTLLAAAASAQPAGSNDSATAITVDLSEAIGRTLADNPMLRARRFEISAAEARLQQSSFRPPPVLNVALEDTLGTDAYRGLSSTEATVSLGWILERGVHERIVEASRAGIEVSAIEVEIARLDAAAETARRFIDCLVYQARYRNAEVGVERARDAVEAVRRRVEASRAPAGELARAEAELARAELRLEDYEHELKSAYHRLGAQWGVAEPGFDRVAGDLSGMPAVEPFETLLARLEQNPDLSAFVTESRLAEARLKLARARSRPSWELSGGMRRIEATGDWALVGGIRIPLRLGNRNQGRIRETRSNLDQIEAEAEAARVRTETELFVLYQELVHNMELAERLETDVTPLLETALADTRRAFELGRSSYLEFRAVQTELLEVAYETLDAHTDAWRLAIEIERLTGERLDRSPITQ